MAMKQINHSVCILLWIFFCCNVQEGFTRTTNNTTSYRSGRQIPTTTYETGVGCGTIRMHADHVIEVTSNNFLVGNYFNNDACTWTFTASDCDLSVFCPCFNIPGSTACLEDYLKIAFSKYHDKFCGDNPPVGTYRATTDFLTLRFRSDYKETGKGFRCYVRCTKPGKADPIPRPTDPPCPTGAVNPYGAPTV